MQCGSMTDANQDGGTLAAVFIRTEVQIESG
jgi:hypothetical protein